MNKRPSRPRTQTYHRRQIGSGSTYNRVRVDGDLPSGRRRKVSDRLAPSKSGARPRARSMRSEAPKTAPHRRQPDVPKRLQVRGLGLRAKFMLLMSGVTSIAMLVLGALLAVTTDNFLFDQTRHHGVELAKMTAQVGRAVMDNLPADSADIDHEQLKDRIEAYLNNARRWGGEGPTAYSMVHGIVFEGGPLNSLGVGERPNRRSSVMVGDTDFDIPGLRKVHLDQLGDIDAYPTFTNIDGHKTDVYRFKVKLNDSVGRGYTNFSVWVDVGISNIERVSLRLYLIIFGGILVITALVMVTANYLAGRITKPVTILMRDMRTVAKGHLDHRTKPHSEDEIGVLAGEFNIMTQQLKLAQEAIVEQEKAAYELSIARDVQQQLLPSEAPTLPGFELGAFYKGAKEVSGDYYDFIPLGDDLVGFIIADVSGKGVPGSMVMAVTRTIIRLVAPRHGQQASETLKETNRLISKQIKRGMFVTAFYAVLNVRTGELTYTSAGHNPMAIYRNRRKQVDLEGPPGIAIGFDEGPIFDNKIEEYTTRLDYGDTMVLYTDGFPEAMNEDHNELSDEAFFENIAAHGHESPGQLIRELVDAVVDHRGRAVQSDDLTMVVVRRTPQLD